MKRTFCDFCDQEITDLTDARVLANWPYEAPIPPTTEIEKRDACGRCWNVIKEYLNRLGPR